MIECDLREKQVGSWLSGYEIFWNVDTVIFGINVKKRTNAEEENIDQHKNTGESEHVFLRFADVLATEIFLHQILIESDHRNGDEHSAKNLLHEMKPAAKYVFKEKHF